MNISINIGKQKFFEESRKLELIFNEDSEWVYRWCEFVQSGELLKAKYINSQVLPKIRSRMLRQLDITVAAMGAI